MAVVFIIIYIIGFFCVPALILEVEKKHPGSMKSPEQNLMFIAAIWPAALIIMYFLWLEYKHKKQW